MERPEELEKSVLFDIKGEGPSKPGHLSFLTVNRRSGSNKGFDFETLIPRGLMPIPLPFCPSGTFYTF